ncbi:hypothetical protein [Cyanobium sp. ATX 6A2]|uniref:hypothetical protein n=1 Tax=Cyanobium sp. ATX 6A2 TaxID=2823700 RepID=UPI0020CBDB8F|nr:hypothetical protein [Cyanobium sp. ATX 6A2]
MPEPLSPPPPASPPASPPEPPTQPAVGAVGTVLRLWALALALSAGLAAAGQHWPAPLVPTGRLVWALVLGPPLLMALWLTASWRLEPDPGAADRGESGD